MKITIDTNVLVRAVVKDDAEQSVLAKKALTKAAVAAVPVTVFCEFDWVLRSSYRLPTNEIADVIRDLLETDNVVTNVAAIEAGLRMVAAGGDFADGVIAFEGASLGGEIFYSFDKAAIAKLTKQGVSASLLTT